MADHTFYASGSSKEFLEERGFDKKWAAQDDKKKKKEGWEEVLIKGSKKLSAAEKKARADKVSKNVLKNADAVRVDIDGEKLMKLIDKDSRKRGEGGSKNEGKEPGVPKVKAPPKPAAPKEEKKKPSNERVPLTAADLRAKLNDLMANHLDKPDLQLLSLAELFEESYAGKVGVWTWAANVADYASAPSSWGGLPLSLLPAETRDATAKWLLGIAEAELATFLDFLVENALPGGGASGRGGATPYYGLMALLQLLLQDCGGRRKWHDDGRRIARNVLLAEGRVSAASAPAVVWMLVQLAEPSPSAALRGWFAAVLPVVENERAGGGKLAAQCVGALKHIVGKQRGARADGGTPPVTLEQLVRLMELFHPFPTEGDAKAAAPTGKKPGNPQALAEMSSLYEDIVLASPIGFKASSCGALVVPTLLPLVCSEGHSEGFRACALGILLRVLGTDKGALKVWEGCHTASLRGSAALAGELSGRWKGLRIEAKALEKTMRALVASGEEMLGKQSGGKELSEAAAAARKGKTQKRAQKAGEVEEMVKACQAMRGRLAARRTTRNLAWFGLSAFAAAAVAAAVAVNQPECWQHFEPIVQGAVGMLQGGPQSEHVTYPVVEAAVKTCSDSIVRRVSISVA